MAHFYSEIQGNRGEATRMGSKDSGIRSHIRGWHVGGSVNCHYNESKDRDEVSIYATKGSSDGGREHLADVIEKYTGIEIRLNPRLDKYLNEYGWVDMKEKISATIFDYESPDEEERLCDETCNHIAELIMKNLGYKLIQSEDDDA